MKQSMDIKIQEHDLSPTWTNGMDTPTDGANLSVFLHSVDKQFNRFRLEVNIPIQRKNECVLCL